jgi:hypothetical protein
VDKVKGFGEADAFPSDDAEARRIWPEFTRLADNHFVRRRRTMERIDLATFRVDCLAIRETELYQYYRTRL